MVRVNASNTLRLYQASLPFRHLFIATDANWMSCCAFAWQSLFRFQSNRAIRTFLLERICSDNSGSTDIHFQPNRPALSPIAKLPSQILKSAEPRGFKVASTPKRKRAQQPKPLRPMVQVRTRKSACLQVRTFLDPAHRSRYQNRFQKRCCGSY